MERNEVEILYSAAFDLIMGKDAKEVEANNQSLDNFKEKFLELFGAGPSVYQQEKLTAISALELA